MFLIATPVFRASFTGALKNLLDHVPVEGLHGKACGLIGMGATDHHYLSVDAQLRPVLAWFGAHVAPGMVYLQSRHFQDGRLADEQAIADLQSLARSVVALHRAIAGGGNGRALAAGCTLKPLLSQPPLSFPSPARRVVLWRFFATGAFGGISSRRGGCGPSGVLPHFLTSILAFRGGGPGFPLALPGAIRRGRTVPSGGDGRVEAGR